MIPTSLSDLESLLRPRAGGRDTGYTALILCGPLLIAVLVVAGRTPLTTALAVGYVLAFVLYLLWKTLKRR